MAFHKEILSEVLRELEHTRTEREQELSSRRAEIYSVSPRLRQIDMNLQSTATAVIRQSLESGDDPSAAIASLREQNLSLQEERKRLLTSLGYPSDYLTLRHDCPACADFGYIGTEACACLKAHYAHKLTERLSTILPIRDQNFETFNFTYYTDRPDGRLGISPRQNIEYNFDKCSDYARHFCLSSPNLLLFGSAGLGKTFLSTCIAKTVSEKGFSVAYDTAINILSCYETLKFSNGDLASAQRCIRKYEGSDLLIVDDLGTELTTSFTVSAFYQLLNNRLMRHRPMIINTNLLPDQLEKQYSVAIASRLLGEFTHLRFFGEDIRQIKKREN